MALRDDEINSTYDELIRYVPVRLEKSVRAVFNIALAHNTVQRQEPYRWIYTVNGVHECCGEIKPPDDAYDEGTLRAVYVLPLELKIS